MKIAILLPAHGDTKAKYTQSALNMVSHTMRASISYRGQPTTPQIECFLLSQSNISRARNELLSLALKWDADYALWTDADHTFPPDALLRLLQHDLPIVACNYPKRNPPIRPTASRNTASGQQAIDQSATDLQEAYIVGLGLCLMSMGVLSRLQERADELGNPLWPVFKEEWLKGPTLVSEDAYFCGRVRDAGIKIMVDSSLSRQVGHIGEQVLYLSG